MKNLFVAVLILAFNLSISAKGYTLKSPGGKIQVDVAVGERVTYSVSLNGTEIVSPSPISMELSDGTVWGKDAKVKKSSTISVSQEITPIVPRKFSRIAEEYNQLMLLFRGYALQFRAYDDGVAYRWVSERKGDYKVITEEVTFRFPEDHKIWFPEEESMFSHQERYYKPINLSEVGPDRFCSTGMLVDCGAGVKTYISESGLMDYPGMFLKGDANNTKSLVGKFAGVVMETDQPNDRDVIPTKHADYIAERNGAGVFPWRLMVITENDVDLVKSELVYLLGPENRIEDTSWIKPGKVAWDWWNANNIYGVDFKSGVNNETYKYYIDFASKNNLEYIILDEGWYHLENVLNVVDSIDIKKLVDYGKERNVGVILWVVWKALDDQLIVALDQFQAWGVKGIKIDFMQRDDQWMVNFYEKIAYECAKRQLLVDYHGSYKPSGLNRAYPNVLNYEGLKGLENGKWSLKPDPEHNTTLPFTRMVAGPMDYTPGAMINATKKNMRDVFTQPMSAGTRCHQLAMYVVFESPLQMLCDNPSNYYKESGCMEFLSVVPSVWDDTKVLKGEVGNFIAIARRAGDTWYVGAMTDWDSRELNFDLSFLNHGEYSMSVWKDGVNADKHAADFAREKQDVTLDSKIKVKMAPGGGWVAIIKRKN